MRRNFGVSSVSYTSEAELCDEFVDFARAQGFRAYPETGDFDLLLVASDECPGFKPGDQIGVQAKLRPNVEVLCQSLPRGGRSNAPHYYLVLVPQASDAFESVAEALKITPVSGAKVRYPKFSFRQLRWFRNDDGQRCWVPDCEVEGMQGGMSGPRQLTPWKQSAIQLCLRAEAQGFLLGKDFKEKGLSIARWISEGWLKAGEIVVHEGKRVKRYYLVLDKNPPHLKHAEVTAALRKAGIV
jgi:hypothetical protein